MNKTKYLHNINSPDDVKKLTFNELDILSDEIRDKEKVVNGLAKDIKTDQEELEDIDFFKTIVFSIAGGLAGISGALYTVQSGIVSPQFMTVPFSIEMVIWVAVGG